MSKAPAQQKSVLESIYDWSLQRPAWQRDALRRIIAKGKLDETDIVELTAICKKERLGEAAEPKSIPLEKNHPPANPDAADSVALLTVANVEGVNNLASGQTLTFEPNGLTVIYGDNGTGKSGYGRILKGACRARHTSEIVSNIFAEDTQPPPSATITYSIGGVEHAPENWQCSGGLHHVLSAVSVFDSDCASVHIDEKNEVAFRPFGLDVPEELAGACQKVKEALTEERKKFEKSRNPIFLKPSWRETTVVGKSIASITHSTDSGAIEGLATLSEEEKARLANLKEDLAKDPIKAAAEQRIKADNIKRLLGVISVVAEKTTDEMLTGIFTLGHDAKSKRKTAKLAAEKAFSGDPLVGVGGDVWRELWKAARLYSEKIAYPDQPFPPSKLEAKSCVLCQQPLQAEALDRMGRFESFIKENTERQAQESEALFNLAYQNTVSQSMDIRSLKSIRQEIAILNQSLAREVIRFFASARLRRYALVKALENGQALHLPNIVANPSATLTQLEDSTRSYAAELQKSALAHERKKLEMEFFELSDRANLNDILPTITEEIERVKTIFFLDQCLTETSTTAITRLGNEIADTVITPKLRDRFQEEIVKLAADKVRVEIVRSGGRFGNPQYQVRLFANPDTKVGGILSEGEKTCVALAAFMTELATATHKSTLVFDDPVTSLDHRWRKKVAERLVAEAGTRQIIVFTHDLIFLNDLHDLMTEAGTAKKLISVRRGQQGAGIVNEGLPWKAQRVEARIDQLEKDTRSARALYDNDEEDEYARNVSAIYSHLRATWERALESVAFSGIILRHRDYIDTKNIKKVTALNDSDCDIFSEGYKKCCDYVSAHDSSRGRNADVPPPGDVLQDIQTLKDWVSALKIRQKAVA